MDDNTEVASVMALMRSTNSETIKRGLVLSMLAELPNEDIDAEVVKCLNHSDPGVQILSAVTAGERSIRTALPGLNAGMSDTDWEYRLACAISIRRILQSCDTATLKAIAVQDLLWPSFIALIALVRGNIANEHEQDRLKSLKIDERIFRALTGPSSELTEELHNACGL